MPVSYSEDSAGPSTRRSSLTGVMTAPAYEDYSDWTKDELKDEALSRGLAVGGTKAELVARLLADE